MRFYSKQGSLEELFIAPAKATTNNDRVKGDNSTAGVEYLAGSFSKTAAVNGINNTEKVHDTLEEIKENQVKPLR